jgi:HEAT repeat protein
MLSKAEGDQVTVRRPVRVLVRWAVVDRLGENAESADAAAALLRMLNDPIVCWQVARVMSRNAGAFEPALPQLTAMLDDPELACRLEAAWAICRMTRPNRSPRVLSIIREALADNERGGGLGERVIMRLDLLGTDAEAVLPELEAYLRRRDLHYITRKQAASKLPQCGPKATPLLMMLLRDKEARSNAASSLGMLGAEAHEALPCLESLLDDPDDDVRAAVRAALHQIDPKRYPR